MMRALLQYIPQILTLAVFFVLPLTYAISTGPQGIVQEITQPDGTKIQVRIIGDEFSRTIFTLDGYTIALDSQTQTYQYVKSIQNNLPELSGEIVGRDHPVNTIKKFIPAKPLSEIQKHFLKERRDRFLSNASKLEILKNSSRGIEYAPPATPTSGKKEGFCLLIAFADDPQTPVFPRNNIELMFNGGPGETVWGNAASISQYYAQQSNGKLELHTTVSNAYVRLSKNRAQYDATQQGPSEAIREALTIIKNENPTYFDGLNLTTHTENGQQIVSAFSVFYPGNPGVNGLWPHSWILNNGNQTFTIELKPGVFVRNYQISSLLFQTTAPVIGVACHEIGHMLCHFSDYYDYGNRGADGDNIQSSGLGNHCIMGNSLSNTHPAQFNPYLRMKAGWIEVPEITAGAVTVTPSTFFKKTKSTTEYFIVSSIHKPLSNWTSQLPGSGLAVWHIDETMPGNEYEQRTLQFHYECSLEQADGLYHLEMPIQQGNMGEANDYYGSGNRTAFTTATMPNSSWWDGAASRFSLTNIAYNAVTGNVTMSVADGLVPVLSVSPANANILSGGGEINIIVSNPGAKNLQFTVNTPDWITASQISGILTVNAQAAITLTATANPLNKTRTGIVTVSSTTPDVVGSPQTVIISQSSPPTAPAPEFSRTGGNFSTPFNLEIKSVTSGLTFFYTLDGSTPTPNSARYTEPILVSETVTVKAIAVKTGMLNSTVATAVYTYVPLALAETPVFSRTTQSFSIPFTLRLTSPEPGVKIYYTTDGSTPTTNASVYKGEIYIGNNRPFITVKAFAVVEGKTNSPIVEETFTYSPNGKVEAPLFDRAEGVFSSAFYLNLSCSTNGATIAYTTDGTTPSAFSPIYNGGIKISRTATVKAVAFFPGMANSEITSVTFTQSTQLPVSAPVFSQTASIVRTPAELRLSSPTEGAQIYYTFSDTTLPSGGMLYQKPILIDRDMTIRAIAVKEGLENSPVVVQNYRYNPHFELTAPVFVIPSRSFSSPFTLKIISPAVSATLYYGLHLPGTVCTGFKPYPREGILISSDIQVSAYAIQEGIRSETASSTYYYKEVSPVALGSTLTLEAVDCPDLPRFEKPPVIKGSYEDFNGHFKSVKFKRVGLTADRVTLELNSKVMLFNRSLLFRGYYAQGLSALDFLADGNQDSKIVTLTVKSGVQTSNAAQGLVIAEPVIDSVNGEDFELNHPLSITRGGTLSIQGTYFGKKSPKAWVEYAKNGKVAKLPVKIVKYTFSFNPENGKTVFTVQMPVKFPRQMQIPGVYTLVFDTGCGLTALNLNLR